MSVPTTRPDGPTHAPRIRKPAQRSAADVQSARARSVAEPREELAPSGLPHLRLELQALQLRGLVREQVALPRHPYAVSDRRPASARLLRLHGSARSRAQALARTKGGVSATRPSLPLRTRSTRVVDRSADAGFSGAKRERDLGSAQSGTARPPEEDGRFVLGTNDVGASARARDGDWAAGIAAVASWLAGAVPVFSPKPGPRHRDRPRRPGPSGKPARSCARAPYAGPTV
jgi:hypothetical protein